jgi:Ribbon-helix-helix protein, copG family
MPFDLSPIWCNVMKNKDGCQTVKAKKDDTKKNMRPQREAAVRASISFPPDVYETLEVIAKGKKVSLAWVVREAAEQYIGERWPLFSRKAGAQR